MYFNYYLYTDILGNAWIGANILAYGQPLYNNNEIYRWAHSNGTLSFESWKSGEPSRDTEGCALIQSGSGLWNDNPCHTRLEYICEIKTAN